MVVYLISADFGYDGEMVIAAVTSRRAAIHVAQQYDASGRLAADDFKVTRCTLDVLASEGDYWWLGEWPEDA